MKTAIKPNLDMLKLNDIYSLMLFILYKTQEIPAYATLSKLCYLIDGNSLSRLMTYFAGQTVTFPTEAEFVTLTSALLMYQYVNIEGMSYADAMNTFDDLTPKQKDAVSNLYLEIIPIVNQYAINKGNMKHGN